MPRGRNSSREIFHILSSAIGIRQVCLVNLFSTPSLLAIRMTQCVLPHARYCFYLEGSFKLLSAGNKKIDGLSRAVFACLRNI
jgi:hypothetical protein